MAKAKTLEIVPFLSFLSVKVEMNSPYGIPEDSLLKKEQSQQLEDLLDLLPEQYRSILYLREYEEFSYREIMVALNLTEEQVKVTLYRARKRLSCLAEKKGWEYDGVE